MMPEAQIHAVATDLALRITGKYIDADEHGGPIGAADMFLEFYSSIRKRLAEKTQVQISTKSTGPVVDMSTIPSVLCEIMG